MPEKIAVNSTHSVIACTLLRGELLHLTYHRFSPKIGLGQDGEVPGSLTRLREFRVHVIHVIRTPHCLTLSEPGRA